MFRQLTSSAYQKKVDSIYAHTYTLEIAYPVAACLIAYIFRSTVPMWISGPWVLAVLGIAIARVAIDKRYSSSSKSLPELVCYHRLFISISLFQGILYGVAWTYLLQPNSPTIASIVVLTMIGLSASAVVGYASDIRVILAFFMPTVLPCFVGLLIKGDSLSHALAALTLLYSVVILKTTIPVNKSILDAFELNEQLRKQIAIREQAEAKLLALTRIDGLTGIANRRYFDECLKAECRRAERDSYKLSLLMIDIDSFKSFNDTNGHVAGDDCLKQVANVLKKAAQRSGELAARVGGEEFAILLPGSTNEEAAKRAEFVQLSLRKIAIPHNSTIVSDCDIVTVSIGVASFVKGWEMTDLVQAADQALYKAKSSGRNQYVTV